MNEEPDIVYEARPVVTELSGDETQADAATFEAICSLLRLYTSRAYIAEASALFCSLLDAFEGWPQAREHFGEFTLSEWLPTLRRQRAAYERGLTLLDAGRTADAYAAIGIGARGMEPDNPRNDRHFSLSLLADSMGESIAATAEALGRMAARIDRTLSATWAYEMFLEDDVHAAHCEAMPPMERAPIVMTGKQVPTTGIWVPTTIRHGCPNVLVARSAAPSLTRAGKRYDYAASDGGGVEPPHAAWSAYDYAEVPTAWRLAWEDTRHERGSLLA